MANMISVQHDTLFMSTPVLWTNSEYSCYSFAWRSDWFSLDDRVRWPDKSGEYLCMQLDRTGAISQVMVGQFTKTCGKGRGQWRSLGRHTRFTASHWTYGVGLGLAGPVGPRGKRGEHGRS